MLTSLPRLAVLLALSLAATAFAQTRIPATPGETLDGRQLQLPQDAPGSVTVLILGFGRRSADATTAWEKAVRTGMADAGAPRASASAQPHSVGFLDIAMLADAPRFVRPIITRAIRGKVPDALKPNFLVLSSDEDAWKRVAGFDPKDGDAAYVMVVDHRGSVLWQTHAPFNPPHYAQLVDAVEHARRETH